MNKITSTLIFTLFLSFFSNAQSYLEEFDSVDASQVSYADGYAGEIKDGEWTITGDGSSGQFSIFGYQPVDADGALTTIDISENNKVYVRAKASSLGTQLRMDVRDQDGFATTLPGITKFLVADYTVFEFDFTGMLQDGGYGGTSCESANAPCDVDPTSISDFQFYINPGAGAFAGSLVIDFIAVGTEPQVGPMSEVFQDHFDDTTSLRFISSSTPGYVNVIEDSQWKILADGTNGMWEPVSMLTFNPATLDTVDISVKNGDDKIYIRMRSTIDGTSIRLDLQDINNFATTAGSITQVIGTEFATYEFNFAGSYQDLAFGGTGCEVGPCDVDSDRIANMIMFVNPGVEAFAGEVHMEYISVGTPLEVVENDEVLVYGDHFSEGDTYVTTTAGFGVEVSDSELKISGDGSSPSFSAIAYTVHDMETGQAGYVDMTENNKFFISAKSDASNTIMRIDLIDTAGFATTLPSFSRLLEEEYSEIEINFANNYIDAAYGGTACESGGDQCAVDGTAIATVLIYPNPTDGGFNGNMTIDYLSFGAPMGDDVDIFKYQDQFDDGDRTQFGDADGFTVEEVEGELIITGDGTSGQYTAFSYTPHDQETLAPVVLDVTSNNKVFVRAKSTVAGTPLRIDLVDENGYATTEPSTARSVGEEYSILEFDFTGTYNDAAYGGTGCETGPCTVDGTTISALTLYIDPNNGGYEGIMTIDWITTIEPLEEEVDLGPVGVDDYSDDFLGGDLTFFGEGDGQTLTAEDGLVKIIGDGTSGQFSPVSYFMNDGTDTIIVNGTTNDNKVFIRAKSTVDGLPLRLDVIDNRNFHTSQAGLTQSMTTEFAVYEYDFSGNYTDGGFGGTACDAGPCAVDGERLKQMTFYLDPGVGAFNGELHFDWISFGEPLPLNVIKTEISSSAKIYPNPAKGEFYLEMDNKVAGVMTASFLDISGKLIKTQNLGASGIGLNSKKIDVSNLSPGMYFLQVSIDKRPAFYQKLFVN